MLRSNSAPTTGAPPSITARAAQAAPAAKLAAVLSFREITPSLAEQWLTKNRQNRRFRQDRAEAYAREMTAGLWREDSLDAIMFDTEGWLVNGQHRLWAISKTGMTLRLFVAEGVDPALVVVLDTPMPRTAADLLEMTRGLVSSRASGYVAAIRHLRNWERFPDQGPIGYHRNRLSNQEVLSLLPEYEEGLNHYYPYADQVTHAGVRGGRGLWLTMLVRLGEKDAERAERFAVLTASGSELPPGSPLLALRDRLLREGHVLSGANYQEGISRLIVHAWNAWRQGRKLLSLRHRPHQGGEPTAFPTIR